MAVIVLCRRRAKTLDRLLDDRQIDQRREHAEGH
jgi:hypothetical protein